MKLGRVARLGPSGREPRVVAIDLDQTAQVEDLIDSARAREQPLPLERAATRSQRSGAELR